MGSSSSDEDHSPKKRQNRDHNHNLNNPPPPPNITRNIHPNQAPYPMPPHTMAYPPPPGYGYGCQNGYPAGHAHPNAYYYPQGAAGGAYYGSSPATSSFFRGFILCSFFILMSLFLCSLIFTMILRPEAPHYKVESFSVSNFNAGNSSVTADWESKITIENPNQRLNAYFSNWKVTVYHGHVEMARSFWLQGFELGTHQNRQVDVKLSSNSQDSSLPVPKNAVEEIMKERATGSITVGLGISTLTTFRHFPFLLSRSRPIYAYCANLKLNLQGNTANAAALLDNDNIKNCALVNDIF